MRAALRLTGDLRHHHERRNGSGYPDDLRDVVAVFLDQGLPMTREAQAIGPAMGEARAGGRTSGIVVPRRLTPRGSAEPRSRRAPPLQ